MKNTSAGQGNSARSKATVEAPVERAFDEIVELIRAARQQAARAVNTGLIELYWRIGDYLHRKIEADGWAKGTVVQLAAWIAQREPGLRGFSPQNLWRMRQFFVAYRDDAELSPLLRDLPWSSHLHILSRSKRSEEREFYLRMATQNRWSVREVARQLDAALFERAVLSPPKLSTALRELHPAAASHFKDVYLLEFLALPGEHSEADLHQSLLRNLGRFLTELGRDFCYVGSEYPVQVGGQDFALDLLFFHRGLNCLLAIELKVTAFQPEHLGKLNFYLEALDRDARKPHENPAIGLLLCASKDNEVVEYALSRSLSPALIAEYQTQLPDKKLLAAKLHEFYALNAPEQARAKPASKSAKRTKMRKNDGAAK
ncbi:YhcG family protein [Methyloversatilis sp.]|uniref:PDDEXK nuclease domain-containing protein n=1 Tax=Methyloversatilis sp. TaxID=2569862 RepID=UPI0027371E3B|nr:PDDEXK nuclease domain-containing protein [Methyloversatilis sp.]MDP3454269.1 PDDEXK nuclease domain-containing protein [Methyloversatilis sp.]MDP3579700.1 PDDEXK nuclease domain-containing protein [Methyloversatilis sp.]